MKHLFQTVFCGALLLAAFGLDFLDFHSKQNHFS